MYVQHQKTNNLPVITMEQLQIWLEWAGAKLIAMPGKKEGPDQVRVAWPEFHQDAYEVLLFRPSTSIRALAPNSKEISIMDEILLLPNLCPIDRLRRIIHLRTLVHPLTGRFIWPWTRIAKHLGTHRNMVMTGHKRGLSDICTKIDYGLVCRINDYFNEF